MEFCTSEIELNGNPEVQKSKIGICTGAKSKNRVLHLGNGINRESPRCRIQKSKSAPVHNLKTAFCTSEMELIRNPEVQKSTIEICTGAKSKNAVLHLRMGINREF